MKLKLSRSQNQASKQQAEEARAICERVLMRGSFVKDTTLQTDSHCKAAEHLQKNRVCINHLYATMIL